VDVAVLAQRTQQLDLGHRQAGVAEEREPAGQVEAVGAVAQLLEGRGVAQVGSRCPDAVEQPTPQVGLPPEVGIEGAARAVGVPAGAPVADELRALHGVGGEQAGQPPGHGVAPGGAVVGGVTGAQVAGEVVEPGGAHHRVDDLEQRPRQPVGAPRVLRVAVEQHRHERVRCDEVDARAHAVAAAETHAEPVREPLGEPALDAARGDDDHLAGERVGQGGDQQVGEAVGQRVGALGGVQVQGHAATL
jgi:hypothetical protein